MRHAINLALYGTLVVLILLAFHGSLAWPLPVPNKTPFNSSDKETLLPEFNPPALYPPTFGLATEKPDVFILSIQQLVQLYYNVMHEMPAEEIMLSTLTSFYPDWMPVYVPISNNDLDDQILLSTGIIDNTLIERVRDDIYATGFDPSDQKEGDGFVAFLRGVIPAHYRTGRLLINWAENRIAAWPIQDLVGELNIPVFRWRIWHIVNNERYLIADWPVVVGKTSTRSRLVEDLPMDQIEHYPPWTDPETKEYVAPGVKNPLGLWKLKSTFTRHIWYYHGTNHPWLLKRPYRAFSHGCIRNDNTNIRRLAWLLLSHNAGEEVKPGLASGRIDVFPEKRNRIVPLLKPVQAHNVYDTIMVEKKNPLPESVISFYPNVYWIGVETEVYHLTTMDNLQQKLQQLGVGPDEVDPDLAAELVQKMRKITKPELVPVKAILKPPTSAPLI